MADKQRQNVPDRPRAVLLRGALLVALAYFGWPYLPHYLPYVTNVTIILLVWTAYEWFKGWQLSSSFWNYQRAAVHNIRNPAAIFGQKRLATGHDLLTWGLRNLDGLFLGLHGGAPIFWNPFARGESHGLIYAPSRTGKSISICMPILLHWSRRNVRRAIKKQGWTLIVTDPKGELAYQTAVHRRRMGDRIIILNPWQLYGMPNVRFNALGLALREFKGGNGGAAKHLVERFAMCLIPKAKEGSKDHEIFQDGGRSFLRACMLWLIVFDPENANMIGLRRLVFETDEVLQTVAIDLQYSEALNGSLQADGNKLAKLLKPTSAKLFTSYREYAEEGVRIFDPADALAASVTTSDFEIEDILNGDMTLYIAIDGPHVITHAPWMTLLLTCMIHIISSSPKKHKLLMLLEEAGTIAKGIPDLANTMTQQAAKFRVLNIFHSREQVDGALGENTRKEFETASSMIQWFAVGDPAAAEDISKLAGNLTVSDGSHSAHFDEGRMIYTPGWNNREVPVLPVHDILQAEPPEMFVRLRNKPIIRGRLCPFWKVRPWRAWAADNPLEGPPPDDDPPTHNINY